MVHHRLGRGKPRQREPRRDKVPLLGRARGGGADAIGNSLRWSMSMHMPMGPQKMGWLWHRLCAVGNLLLI